MEPIAVGLVVLALLGATAGAVGCLFYCRRLRRERRTDLGQVLVKRSDSLKKIDELAGALSRAQHAAHALAESRRLANDPRAIAAAAEASRLDAELRSEVRAFLALNRCAEKKGAAPAVLRPPEAEALVCRHVA